MDSFTFFNPTHFVFGKDAELKAGEAMRGLNLKSALIVTGQFSAKRSGVLARVEKSLDDAGIAHQTLSGVQPNPLSTLVYKGIELVKANNMDCVMGIGGGSALDTAKAIAAGSLYDGDFWDFYEGKMAVQKALPVAAVLTISAAGSESSNSSVITHEKQQVKRGINSEHIKPILALMNPELTCTVPGSQKAYGIADMMAHIFERYFTNTVGVELTDELCEGTLRAIIKAAPVALAKPGDYDAHATLMWAGTLAHNNTLAVGRQQDWSSHGIGHGISAYLGAPHGGVLAVLFPHWMEYQLHHDPGRFRRFAENVMGVRAEGTDEEVGQKGIDALRTFFDSLFLPRHLGCYGVMEEDIGRLVQHTLYKNNGKIGFFHPLSPEDVDKLLRKAL